jgi:glycyl-tRNA synthetase
MSDTTEKNQAMENIVSLAKRRGFIYPGSDVYGGLSGTWDYGPLGVTLKRNIMQLWWKMFVEDREDMFGVDAAILMNKKVWEASGHTATFTDPLTTCLHCGTRQRVDKIVDNEEYQDYVNDVLETFYKNQWANYYKDREVFDKFKSEASVLSDKVNQDFEQFEKLKQADIDVDVYLPWLEDAHTRLQEDLSNKKIIGKSYDYAFTYLNLLEYILNKSYEAKQYAGEYAKTYLMTHVHCPVCNSQEWSLPQKFNMMFKTHVGPVADDNSISYLRPETAQGIFTNYKNVVDTFYPDLPFGLAQQGKAFRNEISPRDFIFRSREFEQMEIEYFVNPENWEESFNSLLKDIHAYLEALGLPADKIHELEVPEADRAHYSKRTIDIEYDFPIGKEELLGLAYRTDFDLMNIQNNAGKGMEYTIKGTNTKFVPHVIEPSFGVERAVMAVMSAAYTEDEVNGEKRIVMKFPEHLAPVKYCVSPLLKNKPELVEKAREVYQILKKKHGNVMWDDNGNIGKRYRRQDEIGTPYCVVIDFESLEGDTKDTVTIRDRDTTEQKRVAIDSLS